jgi:exopolyphosphatase/guanosine-5'-triphosphate,3'-diphosphate pyrophosphatase
VRVLAGLLRIADALDRGHTQGVADLRVDAGDRTLVIHGTAPDGGDLEHWAAEARRGLLEKALGRRILFDLRPPPGTP